MLKTAIKSAVVVVLLFLFTFGISILQFVPSWNRVKSVVSTAFVVVSLVLVVFNCVKLVHLRKMHRCSIPVLVGGILAGIVWMGFSLSVFIGINLFTYLSGVELKMTVPVEATGGTVYVYEKGSFPDGFELTRITYGSKWWPFEKKMFVVKEVVDEVKTTERSIDIHFIDGEVKRVNVDSLLAGPKKTRAP